MGKKADKATAKEAEVVDLVQVAHGLYEQALKTGDFREWEHASVAACKCQYGWWDSKLGVKYLNSICNNLDEFRRFTALLCRIGTFGFYKGDLEDVDWDFFADFDDVIRPFEKEHRRKIISNYLTGQDMHIDPNSAAVNLYVAFLPYANSAALNNVILGCKRYGTEVLQAMENLLHTDPDRYESFEADMPFFVVLDSPLTKSLNKDQLKLVRKRNERLWFQQPLRKRFHVGLRQERAWDVGGIEVNTEDVLQSIKKMREEVENEFEIELQGARREVDDGKDFADTATLSG
jgi:hypothetical protein